MDLLDFTDYFSYSTIARYSLLMGVDLRLFKCGESQATKGIFFFLKTGIIGKSGHYGKLI